MFIDDVYSSVVNCPMIYHAHVDPFLTKCATKRDPDIYRNVNRGGVALLIHNNNLIYRTSLLEIDSDRIIGAEVVLSDSTTIYVLCVYLPSSNLSDDLFH